MKDELTIIHCDLDAFFAAVEQRDNPDWKGKPVIIGGNPDSRSVVSTCSYEARAYGVHSAMPVGEARRLCPEGVFLPVDMPKYIQASRQVFAIFGDYTPLVEPLSIDEAFLDVTGCFGLFGPPEQIARTIKDRVLQEVGLVISAGISYNKFLAKLATELGKPDGLMIIREDEMLKITAGLPVKNLWGVGPKARARLNSLGIYTIQQLRDCDPEALKLVMGNHGLDFYQLAWGIDERSVETEYEQKSIGREITFDRDISDFEELVTVALYLSSSVAARLRRHGQSASTVTIKYRHGSFKTVTRRKTMSKATDSDHAVFKCARDILEELYRPGDRVRLLGVHASSLQEPDSLVQEDLFGEAELDSRHRRLDSVIDELRKRFGQEAVTRAVFLEGAEGQDGTFRRNREEK